jgi:orotate phosphoribosyltransferase
MAVARLQSIAASDDSGYHDELFRIVLERSFQRRQETFKLASGIESHLYFNLKATIMDPKGGGLVAQAFLDRARSLNVDLLGGLAIGAVPTLGAIAAISEFQNRPMRTFFVRQERKGHGTRELIEGLAPNESLNGKRVMIVDDVATSGGSILQAIEAARGNGAFVENAMVIIDRERGATDRLTSQGVSLTSLFREHDFASLA